MAAAFDGRADVVSILINAHADVHAQDKVIMHYSDLVPTFHFINCFASFKTAFVFPPYNLTLEQPTFLSA